MDNTYPSQQRINTFKYMIKVWLTTFGVGTAGYMLFMGPELVAANFWALCASIPALLPVFFIVYNTACNNQPIGYKKACICLALLLAYFLTCIVLACFFETAAMFQLALMMGSPHFIIGLLAIWAFRLPQDI